LGLPSAKTRLLPQYKPILKFERYFYIILCW